MVKIIKQPLKMRVISETPNEPNRAQRRFEKRVRTSPTLFTKKWTRGRLKPRYDVLSLKLAMTPKKDQGKIRGIMSFLERKLWMAK